MTFLFVGYSQMFILNCTFKIKMKRFCKKKNLLCIHVTDDSLENFSYFFYLFHTNLNVKHPSLASNIDVCPTSNHFSLLSYLILIYTDTHICTCVDHFFFLLPYIYSESYMHAMETNKLSWKEIKNREQKRNRKKSLGKEIVKKKLWWKKR